MILLLYVAGLWLLAPRSVSDLFGLQPCVSVHNSDFDVLSQDIAPPTHFLTAVPQTEAHWQLLKMGFGGFHAMMASPQLTCNFVCTHDRTLKAEVFWSKMVIPLSVPRRWTLSHSLKNRASRKRCPSCPNLQHLDKENRVLRLQRQGKCTPLSLKTLFSKLQAQQRSRHKLDLCTCVRRATSCKWGKSLWEWLYLVLV